MEKKQGHKVESYQQPNSIYAGEQPGKTTQYLERHNASMSAQAKKLKSMSYKGRYE